MIRFDGSGSDDTARHLVAQASPIDERVDGFVGSGRRRRPGGAITPAAAGVERRERDEDEQPEEKKWDAEAAQEMPRAGDRVARGVDGVLAACGAAGG